MNFEALHQFELPWLQAMQPYRTPVFDAFFKFLNLFDRVEFFLVLVTLLWYLYSPKWALRLFYLAIANSLLNSTFKALFHQPRPLHLDATLGIFPFSSFGFPSGAAQTAVLLPYILIKEWKNKWAFVIGFLFFFLLSFSRVYLGAHFPSDLVGGWFIGLFLVLGFYKLYPWIEEKLNRSDKELSFLITTALLTFFPLMIFSDSALYTSFVALGSFCALFISPCDWQVPQKKVLRVFEAIFALSILLGLHLLFLFILIPFFSGHQALIRSLNAFLIGFSSLFFIPLFCKLTRKFTC